MLNSSSTFFGKVSFLFGLNLLNSDEFCVNNDLFLRRDFDFDLGFGDLPSLNLLRVQITSDFFDLVPLKLSVINKNK